MFWLEVVNPNGSEWTSRELERRAFVEQIYQRESVNLVRLARIFTDDRSGAEDIVQEAFIRLYRAADRIVDGNSSSAYLRSIVLNLARDHNRRGLLSLRHQDSLLDPREPDRPEDRIVRGEDQARVLRALNQISQRQRDCLVLRFYLGLTEREIGQTLAISPNSVKTHCQRGMAAMASILGENK